MRRNGALIGKEPGQVLDGGELLTRGLRIREVADQANADSVFVEVVVGSFAMGAVFLLVPARPHLDIAIRRVRAVSDDKVVAQLVPPFLSVELIKCARPTFFRRAMVQDDMGPARADRSPLGIPRRVETPCDWVARVPVGMRIAPRITGRRCGSAVGGV